MLNSLNVSRNVQQSCHLLLNLSLHKYFLIYPLGTLQIDQSSQGSLDRQLSSLSNYYQVSSPSLFQELWGIVKCVVTLQPDLETVEREPKVLYL